MPTESKPKLATIWLSGCSGCHMSLLDIDETLIDIKTFPENVDITLIEGAVANEEQLELLKQARSRTKILVSMGDCAVTGNVTALRNGLPQSDQAILHRAYIEIANTQPQIPTDTPKLLEQVHPLHEIVKVDYFIPGCPPPAGNIAYVLTELLAGKVPQMENKSKYG